MSKRWAVASLFLLSSAGIAFVAYTVGHSRGYEEAARATPAPAGAEASSAEDTALAQVQDEKRACSRALSWYITQLTRAEAMAAQMKVALSRGAESGAESVWNAYLKGYALDEYFFRDLRHDAELCGLPKRYLRRIPT